MNSPKNESHNVFNYDVQQKLIKQFEDWKQKQIVLFNEKMENKEKQLLKEINNKWIDHKKKIENELTHEIKKCKVLAENLDNIADRLKEKHAIVTFKELELIYQKDMVENQYISLFQRVQSSDTQKINELSNKIFELETKLFSLHQKNMLLIKENGLLKDDINSNGRLQIQQLENTICYLKSICEEAIKSCMFYKERWLTSVRKMNQMYPNFPNLYENTANENVLNKQNVQNILTKLLVEQKYDEEKLRDLLNDLTEFRQDINNTNYKYT